MNGILERATQAETYDACARDIVDEALRGISGAVLAYGQASVEQFGAPFPMCIASPPTPILLQTGSGKTYTMSGPGNSFSERGIVPRAITHVFQAFEKSRTEAGADRYVIRVSYLEIYQDRLFDLLAATPDLGAGGDGEGEGEEETSIRKDGGASERSPAGEGRPAIRGGGGVLQVRVLARACARICAGPLGEGRLLPEGAVLLTLLTLRDAPPPAPFAAGLGGHARARARARPHDARRAVRVRGAQLALRRGGQQGAGRAHAQQGLHALALHLHGAPGASARAGRWGCGKRS